MKRSAQTLLITISIMMLLAGSIFFYRNSSPEQGRSPDQGRDESRPRIEKAESGEPAVSTLAEARNRLAAQAPEESIEWILRELESGKDFKTGNDLVIGSGRELKAWPSYRVFLLDQLFLLDPELAAVKSKELIEVSQSPDEWSIAMRNVARSTATGEEEPWLREKSVELLRNEQWRSDPTVGYLNAFDVIVHTRHIELGPELMNFCENRSEPAVRHAAFLTLDRLVQTSPEEMLPMVSGRAETTSESGLMLSNLVARADLRDALQAETVETYLLSERRSAEELRAFASVFPNANYHVSNNLITKDQVVDGEERRDRDRAALEVVREWIEQERFARLRPMLQRIERRLVGFVGS